jgi:hypothetical protein
MNDLMSRCEPEPFSCNERDKSCRAIRTGFAGASSGRMYPNMIGSSRLLLRTTLNHHCTRIDAAVLAVGLPSVGAHVLLGRVLAPFDDVAHQNMFLFGMEKVHSACAP